MNIFMRFKLKICDFLTLCPCIRNRGVYYAPVSIVWIRISPGLSNSIDTGAYLMPPYRIQSRFRYRGILLNNVRIVQCSNVSHAPYVLQRGFVSMLWLSTAFFKDISSLKVATTCLGSPDKISDSDISCENGCHVWA